jgi:hypothetical protein
MIVHPTFNETAEAIACLEPCPFAGKVTVDQIKVVMVEIGGLMPASVADDPND